MSNWTELKRLEARVDVLEQEVAALKTTRKRRGPEVMRGDWIPLTDVDMREGEAEMIPPVAIKFPDDTEMAINGWKGMLRAVGDFRGVEDWLKDVLDSSATGRHNTMQAVMGLVEDRGALYAIAFPQDAQ